MIVYLWSRHLMIKTRLQRCIATIASVDRLLILWSRHLMIKTSFDQDFSWSRHPMSKTWRIILWRIASYPQRGKGGKNWQFSFWNFFQLKEEEPSIFSDICEADFLISILQNMPESLADTVGGKIFTFGSYRLGALISCIHILEMCRNYIAPLQDAFQINIRNMLTISWIWGLQVFAALYILKRGLYG